MKDPGKAALRKAAARILGWPTESCIPALDYNLVFALYAHVKSKLKLQQVYTITHEMVDEDYYEEPPLDIIFDKSAEHMLRAILMGVEPQMFK